MYVNFIFHRLSTDIKATIRNAIPAQNRLPVKSQTIKAIMTAGSISNRIFTTKIMMATPIINNSSSNINSYID